jgi:hypothetical protein
LLQEVSLKVLADVINLRPQQLQQLQAVIAGRKQLVQLAERLV